MPKRVLITGSRTWDRPEVIESTLRHWFQTNGEQTDAVLVSGACPRGADSIAEGLWERQGLTVERHPADWDKHGMYAGLARNEDMVKLGADICFAFIRDDSAGTSHCRNLAIKAGIPTTVIAYERI